VTSELVLKIGPWRAACLALALISYSETQGRVGTDDRLISGAVPARIDRPCSSGIIWAPPYSQVGRPMAAGFGALPASDDASPRARGRFPASPV